MLYVHQNLNKSTVKSLKFVGH